MHTCITVMSRILSENSSKSLLHDRHLHQIIMCVVFGACKIEGDTEATFKKIITEHRFAFEGHEEIYWTVRLAQTEDQTCNLIEFYNKKFIPTCKDALLEDIPANFVSVAAHEAESVSCSSLGVCVPPCMYTYMRVVHTFFTFAWLGHSVCLAL